MRAVNQAYFLDYRLTCRSSVGPLSLFTALHSASPTIEMIHRWSRRIKKFIRCAPVLNRNITFNCPHIAAPSGQLFPDARAFYASIKRRRITQSVAHFVTAVNSETHLLNSYHSDLPPEIPPETGLNSAICDCGKCQ